ncbi:hypothetical protein GCM10009836_34360 [Pseudonocardia ailaonensis]|uniref:Leucine-binding protein domain-containing protein n=1 Tax=Pseudonocardia ailaonensis TaxID=367279 RepID=A0ABN2N3X9_9PSEU
MRSRPARRALAVAALTATVLVTASCSSPSGSGGAAAGGATGTPLKIGVMAPNKAVISYPDVPAAAQAAARSINAKGGVDGHPLEIMYCNDKFDANQATACARQFVSDGVVATAGDFNVPGQANVLGALGAAGIPSVGNFDAGTAGTDKYSFLFQGSTIIDSAGQAQYAAGLGKNVGMVFSDQPSASSSVPVAQDIVKAAGGTVTSVVRTPNTGDLSAAASTTVSGKPDVVLMNGGEGAIGSIMKSMVQLGYQNKFVVSGSAISPSFLESLGPTAKQVYISGIYPPVSQASTIPGMQLLLSDLAAERAAGNTDVPAATSFIRDPAVNAWLAVYAIAKVAGDAKATDAKGIYDALNKAKDLDFGGIIHPWTPSASVIKILPRVSSGFRFFYAYNGGTPVLAANQPTDIAPLLDK